MNHPNPYIDALLIDGAPLDSNTITYSFWNDVVPNQGATDVNAAIRENLVIWSDAEKASMHQALETWSNVANIHFVQVNNNNASADFRVNLANTDATGLFQEGFLGGFLPPGEIDAGWGIFNAQGVGWDPTGLQQGGFGFITLIHELGHGLGLAHPHDDGGGSSLFPGVASDQDLGEYELNQGVWTTMSYNDGWQSKNGVLTRQGITDYGYFDFLTLSHQRNEVYFRLFGVAQIDLYNP